MGDIAIGIRAVLDAPSLPHDLYNVTAGVWITYKDILDELKKISPSTAITEVSAEDNQSLDRATSRGAAEE